MNLYLISFGLPSDHGRERNYLADGGDQAILVRAEDRAQAEEIARARLVVVAPGVVHAHLVARVLEG